MPVEHDCIVLDNSILMTSTNGLVNKKYDIMDFEFLENFNKLSVVCPPNSYKPKNIPVFRWVFDAITDEKNFKPRYFLVPQTELEKLEKIPDNKDRDSKKCDMFALSFFESEQAARDRFDFFLNNNGKTIYKRFGTQIATCDITAKDGLNEEPNKVGHFNHHPVNNHKYESRFTIISRL